MNKITFLRNKKTGQIIRYNKYAAAEINMEPCDPPWGKEKQAVPDAMPGMPEPPAAIPLFTEDGQPVTLLSQVEAEALVKELFGKDVRQVTVVEMMEYVAANGITIPIDRPTKLQIVSFIHALKPSAAPTQQE